MAGTTGSFGGAGCAAADGRAVLAAALGVIAFALALLVDGEASAAEATAVSAFDCGRGALWGESAPLFEAGCASELAGALGMMEAILSFSTKTYPKSVLTLNMFSSYATMTP